MTRQNRIHRESVNRRKFYKFVRRTEQRFRSKHCYRKPNIKRFRVREKWRNIDTIIQNDRRRSGCNVMQVNGFKRYEE